MATAKPGRMDKVTKELADVNAKLEAGTAQGPRRLELLQRQATLGDERDAFRDAKRREALDDR